MLGQVLWAQVSIQTTGLKMKHKDILSLKYHILLKAKENNFRSLMPESITEHLTITDAGVKVRRNARTGLLFSDHVPTYEFCCTRF